MLWIFQFPFLIAGTFKNYSLCKEISLFLTSGIVLSAFGKFEIVKGHSGFLFICVCLQNNHGIFIIGLPIVLARSKVVSIF